MRYTLARTFAVRLIAVLSLVATARGSDTESARTTTRLMSDSDSDSSRGFLINASISRLTPWATIFRRSAATDPRACGRKYLLHPSSNL